jgi:Zn-dependent membrane protease YugP
MDISTGVAIAKSKLIEHGLKDWSIVLMEKKLSGGRNLHGQCSYRNKVIRLSWTMMAKHSEASVTDTILHEIAHALTPYAEHGPAWQRKCLEIGAKPEKYFHPI